MVADNVGVMLEQPIEDLASVETEPRAATAEEERHWWIAIIAVLAGTLFAVWLLGQLV